MAIQRRKHKSKFMGIHEYMERLWWQDHEIWVRHYSSSSPQRHRYIKNPVVQGRMVDHQSSNAMRKLEIPYHLLECVELPPEWVERAFPILQWAGFEMTKHSVSRLKPETLACLSYVASRGYRPVAAQVNVVGPGVFTWLDQVWIHPETDTLLIVELKTECVFRSRRDYLKSQTTMRGEFSDIDDSMHNRDQIQLGLGVLLLQQLHSRSSFHQHKNFAACVIRVFEKKAIPYPLCSWVIKRLHLWWEKNKCKTHFSKPEIVFSVPGMSSVESHHEESSSSSSSSNSKGEKRKKSPSRSSSSSKRKKGSVEQVKPSDEMAPPPPKKIPSEKAAVAATLTTTTKSRRTNPMLASVSSEDPMADAESPFGEVPEPSDMDVPAPKKEMEPGKYADHSDDKKAHKPPESSDLRDEKSERVDPVRDHHDGDRSDDHVMSALFGSGSRGEEGDDSIPTPPSSDAVLDKLIGIDPESQSRIDAIQTRQTKIIRDFIKQIEEFTTSGDQSQGDQIKSLEENEIEAHKRFVQVCEPILGLSRDILNGNFYEEAIERILQLQDQVDKQDKVVQPDLRQALDSLHQAVQANMV